MSSPDNLLAAAKKAAVSGQRDQARQLLEILLRDEPENEEALILFASLAPDLGSMKRVLEQALLINPTNTRALAGMDWVRKQELLMLRQRMITPSSGGTAAPQTSPLREIIEREMAAQQAAQQAAQAPPAPKQKEVKPLPPTSAPKKPTTTPTATPPPAASGEPQINRTRDRSRQSRLASAGSTPPPGPQPVSPPPLLVPETEPIQPAASAPPVAEPIVVPPAPATPPWDLGFTAPEPRVAPLPPAPTPAAFVPLPFELPPLPTPPGMEEFDAGLGLQPEDDPNPLFAGWPSSNTGALRDRLARPDINTPTRTPTGPLTRTPTGPLTRTPTGPLANTATGPLTRTPTGPLANTPTGSLTRTPTGPLTKTPTGPLIRTPTGPLTSPLTRHQTGPLDSPASHLHQLEHSPSHAAAITEVPLYPNGAFRGLLLALERMQGVNEVSKILRLADLNKYVGNYPADNLVPGVPYTEYSTFGQAMEQYYGEGARDILLRLGERIVTGGKPATTPRGFAATAMRLLPSNIVMRRTLEGLVHDARDLGVLTDLDEREGSYHYIVAVCPYCYGRSTEVGCNALAGVLSASLRAATGRGYRVEEESCRGRGDETCTYRIAKTPSD